MIIFFEHPPPQGLEHEKCNYTFRGSFAHLVYEPAIFYCENFSTREFESHFPLCSTQPKKSLKCAEILKFLLRSSRCHVKKLAQTKRLKVQTSSIDQNCAVEFLIAFSLPNQLVEFCKKKKKKLSVE